MVSRLMATLSQCQNIRVTDFNNLMTLLGRYFQIRDDYLNLASVEVSIRASMMNTPEECSRRENYSKSPIFDSIRKRKGSARTLMKGNTASFSYTPWRIATGLHAHCSETC